MPTRSDDLFAHSAAKAAAKKAPLAERMRPRTLDEYVGQTRLLGPGRLLQQISARQTLPSLIFWGPPGCGKTTLAHLLAQTVQVPFVAFSAVLSGVKELRQILDEAQEQRRNYLERWVLGCRAEEHDQALFHVRQESVLLSFVEAVDLIDEQNRRLAVQPALLLGFVEDLTEFLDSRKDR